MIESVYQQVFAACQAGGMSNDASHELATEKQTDATLAEATARYRASAPEVERRHESTLATWKATVRSNITRKVAALRADGTTAMSEDNLWMVVNIPSNGGPGSIPAARRIFRELIRECGPRVQAFILK